MNDCPCPICNVSMIPFGLLADDPKRQVVFSEAKLEDGLSPKGFRCTNCKHEFGFIGERMVLIQHEYSKGYVDHPNPSKWERFTDTTVHLIIFWCPWNLPDPIWKLLGNFILTPWHKVEAWHMDYDHNQPDWSEEIDMMVLAATQDEARIDAYANPLEEEERLFCSEPDDDWDYQPYSPDKDEADAWGDTPYTESDADTDTSDPSPDEVARSLAEQRRRARMDEEGPWHEVTTASPFDQSSHPRPDHRGEE